MKRFLTSIQDILPDPLFTPDVVARDPIALFLSDLRSALTIFVPRILLTILPLRRPSSLFADISPLGLLFQIFLFFYSLFLIVPLILLGIFVGGISPIAIAWLLCLPFNFIQGPPLVSLPLDKSPLRGLMSGFVEDVAGTIRTNLSSSWANARFRSRRSSATPDFYPREHNGEAWFYVNGIATSRSGMMLDLRRLEQLFQRPITGILNRSMGVIIDVIECIVQRDFSYHTRDVRFGYMEIRAALEARNVDRVVLIGHSQGGIITSLIVDLLLSTVNRTSLRKLEYYSFANASNHFSNPINALNEPTIGHVEHYANQLDPVAQFGVLKFTRDAQRVSGSSSAKAAANSAMSVFRFDDAKAKLLQSDGPNVDTVYDDRQSTANGQTTPSSDESKTKKSGAINGAGAGARKNMLPSVHSAAGQYFSGVLFVRWNTSGHLLINHYIGPDNNILDAPDARRYSRLRKYIGGNSPSN